MGFIDQLTKFFGKSGLKPKADPKIYYEAKDMQNTEINGGWQYVYPDGPDDPTVFERYKKDEEGNLVMDPKTHRPVLASPRDQADGDGLYYKLVSRSAS